MLMVLLAQALTIEFLIPQVPLLLVLAVHAVCLRSSLTLSSCLTAFMRASIICSQIWTGRSISAVAEEDKRHGGGACPAARRSLC